MTTAVFMMDFSATDRRSVSASLRGRDDGRSARYEKIAARLFCAGQNMAQKDLIYTVGTAMDELEARQQSKTKEGYGRFLTFCLHQIGEIAQGARQGALIGLTLVAGGTLGLGLIGLLCQ